MDKAPDAFRTISEVADHLETPAHVLRFWESRFPQIRPVKRAGGRRYYRPADVALLKGIKQLLHDEGLTIRGVQKILREQGVRHVSGLSGDAVGQDLDQDAEAALEAAMVANFGGMDKESVAPERAESATIVALEMALRRSESAAVAAFDPWQTGQDAVVADLFAEKTIPPAPQDAKTSAAPSPRVDDWIAKADLAAALRALPARALDDQHAAAIVVQHRLIALQARLQAPPAFVYH